MVKEKRILSYFIGWLVLGFVVCFIGINNVFAASYDVNNFTAQIYDNVNGTLTSKNTYKETNFYYSLDVNYASYSSGGAWGISSPIPLIQNHTYSMTVDPTVIGCGFTILSTVNRLGVGTSLSNAVSSYQNNTNVNEKFSQSVSNSKYLQYVFTPTINSSYIVFPFSTTSSCQGRESQLSSIVIEDLGESGISQEQINTSLNNQTNELNNSINNSTNTITGEINDMEQSIVDSNKETQDVIKEQFNSCRPSINLAYIVNYYSNSYNWAKLAEVISTDLIKGETYTISIDLEANGDTEVYWNETTDFIPTYYFKVSKGKNRYSYTFTALNTGTNIGIVLNKSGLNGGDSYTITPSNLQIQKGSTASKFEEPNTEICNNRLDEQNNKLDGIQGALTDSSAPDTSGLENSAGWLPAGPLDSILNLPLTMLNSLTNSLNKTCSPLNLTLPYVNKQIQIPCLSAIFAKITGVNGLWTWVGTIASVLILYNYLLNLYAWVDRILTLRAEFDEAMGADLANWGRL